MTQSTVLLLGRTPFDLAATRGSVDPAIDVEILTGTGLEDVREAFSNHVIDTVIMGAGLDQETRIEVVRHVISDSPGTTIHLKDRESGREGMMPFVNGVLTGLTWHQWTWTEAGDAPPTARPGSGTTPDAARPSGGNLLYRMWKYLFGRSDPPEHPPPPPYSPGAGI